MPPKKPEVAKRCRTFSRNCCKQTRKRASPVLGRLNFGGQTPFVHQFLVDRAVLFVLPHSSTAHLRTHFVHQILVDRGRRSTNWSLLAALFGPGRRLRWVTRGDFFLIWGVFFMRFLSLVLEESFLSLFQLLGAFGGPKGIIVC